MPIAAQRNRKRLARGIADRRVRRERRVPRLAVEVRKVADEVGEPLDVARVVLVDADVAEFARTMESDLLRRSLQVVSAVPGAAVAAVEAVARGTRVGEGRIDVRSEEHTSELKYLMRFSYAVLCW